MKKSPLLLLVFLLPLANVFGQKTDQAAMIFLKDGSQLRGVVPQEAENGIFQVTLTDGSTLQVPAESVVKIERHTADYHIFQSGRRVLAKGWYQSFGFHTLTAKRASQWREDHRWAGGGHFSLGRQMGTALGVGAGLGVDVHEEIFLPVFAEVQGSLVRKQVGRRANGKSKLQIPLTYGLQLGYNFALEEALSSTDDFVKIQGSWLLYPSVGFKFPSRRGPGFQLDFGYKFQRYTRTYSWPWSEGFQQKDAVLLKSLAVRAGWFF